MPSDVTTLLPHRPPFLLVDRLCAYDAGRAEAELDVRDALPLAPAGVLPAFLVAEAIAQACAAHAGALARDAGGPPHAGAFVRLERFEIEGEARRGEVLRLTVVLDRAYAALRRYRGEARAPGGTVVARGIFTFATTPVAPAA